MYQREGQNVFSTKKNQRLQQLSLIKQSFKIEPKILDSILKDVDISDHHKNVLVNALALSIVLVSFKKSFFSKNFIPLWFALCARGISLRNVSKEMLENTFQLLRKFNFSNNYNSLPDKYSSQELIQLGWHFLNDLNYQKLVKQKDLTTFDLVRLKLELGKEISNDDLQKISYDENVSLSLFARSRNILTDKLNIEVSEIEHFISTNTDTNPRRMIHIINALNLVHFRTNHYGFVEKGIFLVRNHLLPKITNKNVKNHILGINFYHEGVLLEANQKRTKAVGCFKKAIKYDYGYFEHYHRVASIYHDEGRTEAIKFYEKALCYSSFNKDVLNNYGILLQSANSKKFSSIQKLYEYLV